MRPYTNLFSYPYSQAQLNKKVLKQHANDAFMLPKRGSATTTYMYISSIACIQLFASSNWLSEIEMFVDEIWFRTRVFGNSN